jgi:dTDP-4-amino-4,6-dideoxygalactose transaminase
MVALRHHGALEWARTYPEVIMNGGPGIFSFGAEEKKELMDVMESGYLSRYGSEEDPAFKHKVVTFERELASYIGVRHAVATSSGTGSLICCLAALGIGAGDEVIVPGYTFIASISSIIMSNAIPVLAEIDESLTIDPDDIEKRITPRTKAIMPVHMLGNPCAMDKIMAIAKKHKLFVIEDCCQAAGAAYKGRKLGTYGDISAFSLNVYKMITAGDGGAVVTNDEQLYERAFGYHDQGHKPNRMGIEVGNRSIVGVNMRINELTGAVALAQLRKINAMLSTLHAKKALLKNAITGLPGFKFRTINDTEGECATLLTLIFDSKEKAEKLCEKLGGGTKPLAYSGWHVYNNMEQVLSKATASRARCPYDCEKNGAEVSYHKHMLPKTDAILDRAVNISVGVVDKGLGSGFGININSSDAEVRAVGDNLAKLIRSL